MAAAGATFRLSVTPNRHDLLFALLGGCMNRGTTMPTDVAAPQPEQRCYLSQLCIRFP